VNDTAAIAVLERPEFAQGIVENMPARDYFRTPGFSATGAKKMLKSAAHYRYSVDNPTEPTAAMLLGSSVHEGVLEPATFAERVVCAPDVDKRTKIGKADWADFKFLNEGKIILAPDDFDVARNMIDAVRNSRAAQALLDGAKIEVSLFWECAQWGIKRKARLDALNGPVIVDLKTCTDASAAGFASQVERFQYHVQSANYVEGYRVLYGRDPEDWVFIAVESDPPHAVAVRSLPWEAIQVGARLMDRACEQYRDCLESGIWPGYAETIEPLIFKPWFYKE
jgi:hypothetical protein